MGFAYEKLQAHDGMNQPGQLGACARASIVACLGLSLALLGCCMVVAFKPGGNQPEQENKDRASLRYNCAEGFSDWRRTWTMEKKTWCCQYHNRGCPFDCVSELPHWQEKWSPAQQAWCCHHSGFGCHNPSAAAVVAGSNPMDSPFGTFVTTSTAALAIGEEGAGGTQAFPSAPAIDTYPSGGSGEAVVSTSFWDDHASITDPGLRGSRTAYPSTTFWDDAIDNYGSASGDLDSPPSTTFWDDGSGTTFWDDRSHSYTAGVKAKADALPGTTSWDDHSNSYSSGSGDVDSPPLTTFWDDGSGTTIWDDHSNGYSAGVKAKADALVGTTFWDDRSPTVALSTAAPHTTPVWDDHSSVAEDRSTTQPKGHDRKPKSLAHDTGQSTGKEIGESEKAFIKFRHGSTGHKEESVSKDQSHMASTSGEPFPEEGDAIP